jgi:hypothetical protein
MDSTWKFSTKLLGEIMPIISSVSGNFSPVGRSRKPFNLATGGNTVVDIANYNSTGQIWRVHTFTSDGTFSVMTNLDQFRIMLVGGGGAGGGADGARHSQGGEGGYGSDSLNDLSLGSNSVTIGGGGAAVGWGYAGSRGGTGGTTSIGALSVSGGLGGYFPSHGEAGATRGVSSNIVNGSTSVQYGRGGQAIASTSNWGANTGGGGYAGYTTAGGAPGTMHQGGGGNTGIVVISYRVA